jgi:hypothetical protein
MLAAGGSLTITSLAAFGLVVGHGHSVREGRAARSWRHIAGYFGDAEVSGRIHHMKHCVGGRGLLQPTTIIIKLESSSIGQSGAIAVAACTVTSALIFTNSWVVKVSTPAPAPSPAWHSIDAAAKDDAMPGTAKLWLLLYGNDRKEGAGRGRINNTDKSACAHRRVTALQRLSPQCVGDNLPLRNRTARNGGWHLG